MRSRSGLALLEATAALFVATLGVFGVLQLLGDSVGEIRVVSEQTIASRLLRNEMEVLLARPFASLEPGSSHAWSVEPPELHLLRNAEVTAVVSEHAELPERLCEITVRIRWSSEHGRALEQSLTTLRAREGG